MFMKTMAVGPFDPVATCCLTGATVALPLRNCSEYAEKARVETDDVALFAARARGVRRAIAKVSMDGKEWNLVRSLRGELMGGESHRGVHGI